MRLAFAFELGGPLSLSLSLTHTHTHTHTYFHAHIHICCCLFEIADHPMSSLARPEQCNMCLWQLRNRYVSSGSHGTWSKQGLNQPVCCVHFLSYTRVSFIFTNIHSKLCCFTATCEVVSETAVEVVVPLDTTDSA